MHAFTIAGSDTDANGSSVTSAESARRVLIARLLQANGVWRFRTFSPRPLSRQRAAHVG
jgi:hypothetical protein